MSRPRLFLIGAVLPLFLSASIASAEVVTINYQARILTVAGTPFGFSSAALMNRPAVGSFTYQTSTLDSNADASRGNYLHAADGAFSATFEGRTVTGSATPFLQVENLDPDTFRFIDGGGNGSGTMAVDGSPNANIDLLLAISVGSGAFANDDLPTVFPFGIPPFATPNTYPHTFSLTDGNGTMLLQFTEVQQVPEPGTWALCGAAALLLFGWRRLFGQAK